MGLTLQTTSPVQLLLFDLPLPALVIFYTSFFGGFLTVSLSAAKGTAQVCTVIVSGMSDEKYPAVLAPGQTLFQMGLTVENRTQKSIVLEYNFPEFSFAVPVWRKLKRWLNFYYKKTSFWLILLRYFGIPPFYLISIADG